MTMGMPGGLGTAQPQATMTTLGPRGKTQAQATGLGATSTIGGGAPVPGQNAPPTNSGTPGHPQTVNGMPVPGSGVNVAPPNPNAPTTGPTGLGFSDPTNGGPSNNIFGNGANYTGGTDVAGLSALSGGAASAEAQGNPRAEYGSSNSANEGAQFWLQQGQSASQNVAPTIATAPGMAGLAATAAGQGPVASAVQGQYGQNLSQAMQAQAAAAASTRGGGASLAAAKQGAMQQQAQLAGQAGQQAGTTMANTALGAQQTYANLGEQANTQQADLAAQTQQLNAQTGLGYSNLAQGTETAQLGADSNTYAANTGQQIAANNLSAQQTSSIIGGLGAAVGGIGGAFVGGPVGAAAGATAGQKLGQGLGAAAS